MDIVAAAGIEPRPPASLLGRSGVSLSRDISAFNAQLFFLMTEGLPDCTDFASE